MKYSIITINYNDKEGLRRTIDSVVSQTFTDYEYIIIDGGSTDGSVEVIKEYADKITYWVSEKDRGIYNAMNKGVRQAHGEYVNFMNSGDIFYDSSVLSKVESNLNDLDIVVGNVYDSQTKIQLSLPPEGEITMYHLFSCAIPHQGAFVKRILQQKYPFDERLKISADWKFFLQSIVIDNCSITFVDVPVALYDTNGLSSNNPKQTREEKDCVLQDYFPQRVIMDYKKMKNSECLTQTLTPRLRASYRLDKFVYKLIQFLLKICSR